MEEKETIATLKAELINEFEFASSSYRNKVNRYHRDWRADVTIKVGNSVEKVKCFINDEYHGSEGYGTPDYKAGYNTYTPTVDLSSFAQLKEAGIEIDIVDVLIEYNKALELVKIQVKADEEEAGRLAKIKRGEQYDSCWLQSFNDNVRNAGNKTIDNAVFTLTKVSRDEVVNKGASNSIAIKYKGITGSITMEERKFIYIGAQQNYLKADNTTGSMHAEISDYKTRRAKKEATLVKKFIDEVDSYIDRRDYKKNEAIKQKLNEKAKSNILSDTSGLEVTVSEQYRHNRYARRGQEGYYVTEYSVQINEEKYSVGTSVPSQYNSETQQREDLERVYSIRSFDNLTKEKFLGIIKVLTT
jgi:hypothetical protein